MYHTMFPQSTNITPHVESTVDNPVLDTDTDLKTIMSQYMSEEDIIDSPLELFSIDNM